jgi:hypothetical protein
MSQSTYDINLDNEMDDINPSDSISRGDVSKQTDGTQDSNISAAPTSNVNMSKSARSGPWDQSNLIFVKDDKYESNVEYLEGLMGVFQILL